MGPDDDLYSIIETHNMLTLHLNVYNSDTDRCREVTVVVVIIVVIIVVVRYLLFPILIGVVMEA